MKKVMILFSVIALNFACGSDCSIDKPKNLKPIDWEGWNDVYTVYWNSVRSCDDPSPNFAGEKVKVYGWIPWSFNSVYLCDNVEYATDSSKINAKPIIEIVGLADKDRSTKKCYVEGSIILSQGVGNYTSKLDCVEIIADTIYFEE